MLCFRIRKEKATTRFFQGPRPPKNKQPPRPRSLRPSASGFARGVPRCAGWGHLHRRGVRAAEPHRRGRGPDPQRKPNRPKPTRGPWKAHRVPRCLVPKLQPSAPALSHSTSFLPGLRKVLFNVAACFSILEFRFTRTLACRPRKKLAREVKTRRQVGIPRTAIQEARMRQAGFLAGGLGGGVQRLGLPVFGGGVVVFGLTPGPFY